MSSHPQFPHQVRATAQEVIVKFANRYYQSSFQSCSKLYATDDFVSIVFFFYIFSHFRVKEVDWIQYLTTKLVDDAASHLRLYRQARSRIKRPPASAPYNPSHSRQASGSKFDTKLGGKDTSPMHSSAVLSAHLLQPGNTKHQSPTQSLGSAASASSLSGVAPASPSVPIDLETAFFDLEVTMEDNLLCRDLVCTEKDQEKRELPFQRFCIEIFSKSF